jgi:hypothetical protein
MQALGLKDTPSSSVKALIEKEALKINRSPVFERGKGVLPSATPAKPIATTPAPQASAATPAAPAQPTPAQPPVNAPGQVQKYKVGDKEYTPEQMAAYLEGQQLAMRHQPAPQAPAAPIQPTQQMTPQQQKDYIRQREAGFVAETAPHIDLSLAGTQITPEQADILAAGGPEAVKLHNEIQQRNISYATLLARKTIASEINPILQKAEQIIQQQNATIAPILERERSVAAWETEQEFSKSYPDLAPHIDTARIVGHELVRQFPDWARTVSRQEFIKVVAEQTPAVLQRFGVTVKPVGQAAPAATQKVPTSNGTPVPAKAAAPKPITGQAPNKAAAVSKPVQTREGFQRVAVDSVQHLR